jgi:hypothetical protein
MSTLELIIKGAGLLSTMSSIYSMFFILTKFEQQGFEKKQWNQETKKMNNFNFSLHFDSPNHELSLSSFFLSQPIDFPFKMML